MLVVKTVKVPVHYGITTRKLSILEEGFTGVTSLGFTDAHSWINEAGQGPDYPLLFDENYQPKPAYWGVMDALLGR